MLSLKGITKNYYVGDNVVRALKGVDLAFRKNEFVSILGPSGCGKTTFLNIVGGLDKYTEGDLIINGKSTKEFNDHDWDTYRNHTIGFIFQTYNLISHQNVLSNVELSLTLSGVSKSERRNRAIEALKRVGLEEQIYKKPNQLSGGQMQRVAIARAIVNNPHIILADEPTGALDTETSVQVMEILKDIAKDHLVVMVTHNPELADKYSTRIVRFLDGKVQSDSNPLNAKELEQVKEEVENYEKNLNVKSKKKEKRVGMSVKTAFSLSLKNLLTKKGRTILTAFAGSIGIIGIALILSLSDGFQNYISKIEEETLSSYPLTINSVSTDLSSLTSMYENMGNPADREENRVYPNNVLTTMIGSMAGAFTENDLKSFKNYLEGRKDEYKDYVTDVQYTYDINLNIYKNDYNTASKITQLNPFSFTDSLSPLTKQYFASLDSMINNMTIWQEMIGNQEFLESQYQLAAGAWPKSADEVVLIVDDNNGISDFLLYAIGLRDASEIDQLIMSNYTGIPYEIPSTSYSFDELVGMKYRVVTDTDFYTNNGDGTFTDNRKSTDNEYIKSVLNNAGFDIKIVGIVKQADKATSTILNGAIGYTAALSNKVIDRINTSSVINAQKSSTDKNVVTGTEINNEAELNATLVNLGQIDYDNPQRISIYPVSFEAKDNIVNIINDYNSDKDDDSKIKYTDYVGMLMSSVSTIINAISYVLIAFVSISLVVSSIMIGIITHISVLERTKEIGILRSIGASKRDISRVFNCETFIIGLTAGVLGVVVTVLLDIPINLIIDGLTGIGHIAKLPIIGAIVLVLISTCLTLIAGLIPSRSAARKDPVLALRSE